MSITSLLFRSLLLVAVLFAVVYFIQWVGEKLKAKKAPAIKLLNREGDANEDEWHTYIAGVNHHAGAGDIGGFTGWIENDYRNSYDRKAMGIYNSAGKLLGYIPAKELQNYRVWCSAKPQPCVGFIYFEDGQIRGRVKTLRPCNKEFIETEFSKYLQWVNDNYGKAYLPKSMSVTYQASDE